MSITAVQTGNGWDVDQSPYGIPEIARDSSNNPVGLVDQNSGLNVGDSVGKNYGVSMWPTGKVDATYAVDGTNGTTFHQVFYVPAVAECFRFIYANGGAATYTVASAAVRLIVGSSDFNASGGGWGSVYPLVLPSSGVVPARPSSGKRAGYLRSSWIERPLIARTDSGPGCLVGVRTYIAAGAGTITIPGSASVDLTNWASRSDKEYFVARAQNVEAVTTPANFTSTTNVSYGPVIGVEYVARGRVFTIMTAGDSTNEGAGTTNYGDGWCRRLARTLSSDLGVTVQFVNGAWAGATSAEFRDKLDHLLTLGLRPDLIVILGGSINDISTTLTSSIINDWRTRILRCLALAKDAGVPALLCDVQPVNRTTSTPAGSKDLGSTDSLRIAHNANIATWMPGRVIPFSSVMSGDTESSQVIIKSGYTTDGTHESDSGADAKADLAARYIKSLVISGTR